MHRALSQGLSSPIPFHRGPRARRIVENLLGLPTLVACLVGGMLVAGRLPDSGAVDAQTKEAPSPAGNFDVQKLAEGVFAVVRKDPPGLMVDANSGFIVDDDDVVVVDASGAPSTSKAVLAALRKLTQKPVKYVINTHYHDDHTVGNQVYRDAFPGVEFIAHANAREYLLTTGASNRKSFLENAPKSAEFVRSCLEKNQSLGGGDLTAEERESYTSDLRLLDLALKEAPDVHVVLPTITFEDRLTLRRGDRVIDIRYLGRGHTGADIVVHLPKEGIVFAGDLVVWPVPFTGEGQSHIQDWARTLEKLCALHPTSIVPGHGPVLHDDAYLKTIGAMFAFIGRECEAAVSRGETLDQARKSVNLDEFEKRIAGDSKLRQVLFANYVAFPAVAAAFGDASAKH